MVFILAFVAFFFLSITKSGKSEAKKKYLLEVKKEKSNKRLDNEKEKNKSNEGMAVTQKESYAFVVSGKNITEY
jgi:Na+/H+ antiporter NhaC